MKRWMMCVLCAVMLLSMAACKPNLEVESVPQTPQASEANGSVFLGTWAVSAQIMRVDKIEFAENGSIVCWVGNQRIGGVFTDDGSKLTLTISQQSIVGTYTADGDAVTIVTDNDTLVLTKM